MKKLTIIGAGLSGLYAAYLLREQYDITILEARDRLGGRILTEQGHDLGPSWVWEHHHNMLNLIDRLGLQLFKQYEDGEALYHTHQGIQRFTPQPLMPSARISGGIGAVIDSLHSKLQDVGILLDHPVSQISAHDTHLEITTKQGIFKSDKLIVAMAPRVAMNITFDATLSASARTTLQAVPTWMGHACKCVITYPHAFWRDRGLSGFIFSHKGPMAEIHDASTYEEAALFGFVHSHADIDNLRENIIRQLEELFGEEALNYRKLLIHDWRQDPYASTEADRTLREHPEYGYRVSLYGDRLHFVSSEAAYDQGGYLEGALRAVEELVTRLT